MKNSVFIAVTGFIFIVVIGFILVIAAGGFFVYAEHEKTDRIAKINQNGIKELSRQLAELKLKLDGINKKVKNASKVKQVAQHTYKHVDSKGLAPKLKKIKLPLDATKEQAEKYIDEILAVSKSQNSFTSNDIQVYMFEKVGHKYLPLLVSRMTDSNGPRNFHISLAVSSLVEESDKKLVLKKLYNCPKLIDAVVKFGWGEDVKDIIFKKIRISAYLPSNWLVCAGQLAKPENYDVLIGYFLRSHNREMIYKNIKDLPGIKLDDAVATVWKNRRRNSNSWMEKQLALIAADFGYLDALKIVIELRNDRNQYFHRLAYDKIYSLTGLTGNYAELKKWFDANKDKLFFDKKTKRYAVKGQKNLTPIPKVTKPITRRIDRQIYSKDLVPELRKIKLSPDATKKQVEEYIDKIIAVSKKQTRFTSHDMQISMLEEIDHKYLPLLIKRMNSLSSHGLLHLDEAVASLAKQSDKKLILQNLGKSPMLIDVVMKFNWSEDAKKIIFRKIENSNSFLPLNWFRCASKVANPADYEVLINYFIENDGKQYVYDIMKKIPGIKLDRAVETVWRSSKWSSSQIEKNQCALIAAEYGYMDALKALVKMLDDPAYKGFAYDKIVLLTGKSGSNEQVKKWFAANKDKLFFDKTTKRYVLQNKK